MSETITSGESADGCGLNDRSADEGADDVRHG
jgi:hypothetical protein